MMSYPYKCNICEQSYKRSEHLSRHLTSHSTDSPSFKCGSCGKLFNRKDVMLRHQNHLHVDVNAGAATTTARASRASPRGPKRRTHEACHDCAVKKVRCDGNLPCGVCFKRKLHCTYSKKTKSTGGDSATSEVDIIHEPDRYSALGALVNVAAYLPSGAPKQCLAIPNVTFAHSNEVSTGLSESLDAQPSDALGQPSIESYEITQRSAPTSVEPGLSVQAQYSFDIMDFLDWQLPSHGPSRVPTAPGSPVTRPDSATAHGSSSTELWPQHLELPQNHFTTLPSLHMTEGEVRNCDTAHVPPISHELRTVFLLRLHDISDHAIVPIDLREFPKTEVLNACMQLYFDRFHPKLPILQRATFNPSNVSTGLLLMIITIGVSYKDSLVAVTLQEVAREVIRVAAESDNSVVREVDFNQMLLLWQHAALALGNKRMLEICESQRSMLITHCRRGHFLLEPSPMQRTDDLEKDWVKWSKQEERKRLGLAIWLTDALFVSHLHMLPYMCVDDLQCTLACEDRFWNARTAHAWQSQLLLKSCPDVPMIRPTLDRTLRGTILEVEDFNRRVFLQALRRTSNFANDSPFSESPPTFASISGAMKNVVLVPGPRNEPYSSHLQYYILQMEIAAPLHSLQARAGRSVSHHVQKQSDQQIRTWLASNNAAKSVYYAAAIYHFLCNYPSHSIDEPIAALNSALVLWAYTKYSTSQHDEAVYDITISSHSEPESDVLSTSNCHISVKVVMQGIGHVDGSNQWKLLQVWRKLLQEMDVCQMSRPYAEILHQMAIVEQTCQGQ